MSDDETSDEAMCEGSQPASQAAPAADVKSALKSQVAYCRNKLQELKKLKTALLKDEDFLGAKDAKDKLRQQEEEMDGLRTKHLDQVPTPIRKRMRSRIEDPKGEVPDEDLSGAQNKEARVELENQWDSTSSSKTVSLISSAEERPFAIPRGIYDKLYDYQRIGVAWMARLWQKNTGGILADEMGLGKTIQICALLNGARKSGATHALLLLPVTLLDQWSREAKIWCPGWPVYTYYGSPSQKARALQKVSRPAGGILLTSYSVLGTTDALFELLIEQEAPSQKKKRRKLDSEGNQCKDSDDEEAKDAELPEKLPKVGDKHPWDLVVCDEAHRMKNIGTLLGKSLRHLRSKSRFLLTGTPVQNAMQDLWALIDFSQPGLLGNHTTFVKRFSDPIDQGSVREANPFQVELKRHLSQQLRTLIRPHVLRRTKLGTGLVGDSWEIEVQDRLAEMDGIFGTEDKEMETQDDHSDAQVKKLPPKLETIVWLMPTAEQLSVYQKILEKSEIIKEASEKTKLGLDVFRAINLLKRLCNHPALLIPCPKPGQWAEFLAEATGSQEAAEALVASDGADTASAVPVATGDAEADDARAGRSAEQMVRKLPRTTEAILQQSAKLRCVNSLIPTLVKKGHRILVFSHSLKMLDLVQICTLKPAGISCLRIDGQTHPTNRAAKVRKFQEQTDRFQVMLLTTNVGGVGLNLTTADRVILMDPAWNPAVDAQAVDRAFRIGQEREVRVYRLIMSGLIEDKMFRLQVFKMGITRTALEGNSQHSYFTAREIRALFEWTDPSEGSTRKMLIDKHGVDSDLGAHAAADDDGGKTGWLDEGPAVGLSDLSLVFGTCAKEEAPVLKDVTASEHMSAAKEKLDEVDKRFQEKKVAREAAEAEVERMRLELDGAIAGIEQSKEQRFKAEETLKELRSKHIIFRREASHAKQLLEKVNRTRLTGSEQRINASQSVSQFDTNRVLAEKTFDEASSAVRSSEEGLSAAIDECELHGRGNAETSTIITAPKTMTSLVKESLKTLKKHLDAMAIHQAELECANDGLAWADKGLADAQRSLAGMGGKDRAGELEVDNWTREQQKAEDAHKKTQENAEEAWDETAEVVSAFVETGASFAESFEGVQKRNEKVLLGQVQNSQAAAKKAFRQVSSLFIAVRKAREALARGAAQRRKAVHKSAQALSALKLAEHKTASAECEYDLASTQEETRRGEFDTMESQVALVEAEKETAAMKEEELKKLKEDLKEAIPEAKEAARVARSAEKEVINERQSVQAKCSKVERAQLKMEDLMHSAVEKLKSEEYNTRQHDIAYAGVKRKGTVMSLHLPDCKEAAEAAAKSYDDACNIARSAEERLSEAFKACQSQLEVVDAEGRATGDAFCDVSVEKLVAATAAIDKLQTSLDTMAIRQAELECADEDLIESYNKLTETGVELEKARQRCSGTSLDKKTRVAEEKNCRAAERTWKQCEKLNQHALSLQAQAQSNSESTWEEMSQGVQSSLEAGQIFADGLEPNQKKNPLLGQVKTAQQKARAVFRQVSLASIAVRKAREGWVKAASQRRKTVQKESAAMVAFAEVGPSEGQGSQNQSQ